MEKVHRGAVLLTMEYVAWLQDAGIYHGEREILSDVTMSLSRAEFVYLIGKTGSGKTSLLKTLWGEIPLKQGKGRVAGIDLVHLDAASTRTLRRKLGIVFQDFYLFEDWSVWHNLQFVLEATGWTSADGRRKNYPGAFRCWPEWHRAVCRRTTLRRRTTASCDRTCHPQHS